MTVLGAVIIYAFQALAKSNLPYIADFISDIIDIIEKHENNRRLGID